MFRSLALVWNVLLRPQVEVASPLDTLARLILLFAENTARLAVLRLLGAVHIELGVSEVPAGAGVVEVLAGVPRRAVLRPAPEAAALLRSTPLTRGQGAEGGEENQHNQGHHHLC